MEYRKIVQDRLTKWMHEFDTENRNNRISSCIVAGMGGFLENLIIDIISEIEKQKKE